MSIPVIKLGKGVSAKITTKASKVLTEALSAKPHHQKRHIVKTLTCNKFQVVKIGLGYRAVKKPSNTYWEVMTHERYNRHCQRG